MNDKPNYPFLLFVLVFGVVAIGASVHWFNEGSIVIRSNDNVNAAKTGRPAGPPAGVIAGDHVMYYPLCIAWGALGAMMLLFAAAAALTGQLPFFKLAAYACAAILPLGFATVFIAIYAGPP
jgi:hypothetical protein